MIPEQPEVLNISSGIAEGFSVLVQCCKWLLDAAVAALPFPEQRQLWVFSLLGSCHQS